MEIFEVNRVKPVKSVKKASKLLKQKLKKMMNPIFKIFFFSVCVTGWQTILCINKYRFEPGENPSGNQSRS